MSSEENRVDWQRSSNLNQREIDEARCFLNSLASSQGIPPYCGLNADGNTGCKKIIRILEQEWIQSRKRSRKSTVRKQPYLVINEKRGKGLHTIDRLSKKINHYANVNYYCFSCNRINKKKLVLVVDKDEPYSNKKTKIRNIFKNDLLSYLRKEQEICKIACINKWSDMYDCAQSLLEKSLAQIDDKDVIIVQKSDWGFDCHYPNCNGEHIITFDKIHQPLPIVTDLDVINEEIKNVK